MEIYPFQLSSAFAFVRSEDLRILLSKGRSETMAWRRQTNNVEVDKTCKVQRILSTDIVSSSRWEFRTLNTLKMKFPLIKPQEKEPRKTTNFYHPTKQERTLIHYFSILCSQAQGYNLGVTWIRTTTATALYSFVCEYFLFATSINCHGLSSP